MTEVLRFVLRLSPEFHEQMKSLAEREHRSLHGQILHMLQSYMQGETR